MKAYTPNPEKTSRTLDNAPRTSAQPSLLDLLQTWGKSSDRSSLPTSIKNEEDLPAAWPGQVPAQAFRMPTPPQAAAQTRSLSPGEASRPVAGPIQCFHIEKEPDAELPEDAADIHSCVDLLGLDTTSDKFQALGIYQVNKVGDALLYDQFFNAINAIAEEEEKLAPPPPSQRANPKGYYDWKVVEHALYGPISTSGPEEVSEATEGIWQSLAENAGGAFYHPAKNIVILESASYSKRNLLHELGHFKQYLSIPHIPSPLSPEQNQLLEYHNVLLHENLSTETTQPAQKPGEHKYLPATDGTYKRFKYNKPTAVAEAGGIKVKNGLNDFEKTMADAIIATLGPYEEAIRNQIKGQLLADCSSYFEKST